MRIAAPWGVFLICLGTLALGCSHPSVDCPKAFKTCGEICVDTATDVANCGACGTACAAGQVCSAGTCATTCQTGLNACGGSCRDLQTDAANCGACGTACGPGQYCTAGVCGCPPGMAHCGPTVLVWSDSSSFYPTAPEAPSAVQRLHGNAITTTSGSFADFVPAYDAGGFDVVVWDETNFFMAAAAVSRLNDWVSCGGRLIINAFPIIYPAPSATLGKLLGITAANPYCTSTGPDKSIFPDKSTVDLWSPLVAVPSPLAPTQPNLWNTFCGIPYPMAYELTPAAGGTIAGRFDTAGTGPGAIAVTRNGHVVVHAFNASDYRLADANTDGVPDIQALYENEIAYVVKQGPPGLTCSPVETYDVPVWPIAPWTAAGGAYGTVSAACVHDGANGFTDNVGGGGLGDWYYRTDVTVGNPGDKLSMWVQTNSTASTGRIWMGFGSNSTSTWSMDIAPNVGSINLFRNNTYSTYSILATAPQTFSVSTWYRMEVEFGAAGALTGRLYGSDGITLLNTVTGTAVGFTPGGVAFRSWGPTTANCVDTIKVYH